MADGTMKNVLGSLYVSTSVIMVFAHSVTFKTHSARSYRTVKRRQVIVGNYEVSIIRPNCSYRSDDHVLLDSRVNSVDDRHRRRRRRRYDDSTPSCLHKDNEGLVEDVKNTDIENFVSHFVRARTELFAQLCSVSKTVDTVI
uniref:Uncharacterized protein n=1 Tax=Vespula pensylvanica TaxID=30213 RepID=A0A834UAG0_VESPE|nr:hypothetical protein H0235_008105 [Vespula pensylvanica]